MLSVRFKLVGLVLGSFVPALIGAIASERAAERELLDEAALHIKVVGAHFNDLLDEYERHAQLALSFASSAQQFQKDVASRDEPSLTKFIERVAAAYAGQSILVVDGSGEVMARAGVDFAVQELSPKTSPLLARLLAAESVSGLVRVKLNEQPAYAFIEAAPVLHQGQQAGALALLSPVDTAYLEHLKRQLDADFALRVGDRLVAATAGHPAPNLRSEREEVIFREDHRHFFGVETFHPQKLQRTDQAVELTASRDVSELRAMARADLWKHLQLLGAATLIVLALALRFANKLGAAISGIAGAARQVKEGDYVLAPEVKSKDEVQSLTEHFNAMVEGLKERDRLKETFGRYVTRQVADHLMKGDQHLGGELLPVTVLFSDIRAFTTISETMPPRDLLDFLNEYFSGMVEAVLENHGVVDKFIGDAIMAVFGAPIPEPDDPLSAVRAALQMRERLADINRDFAKRGLPEIRTGIGLHYGQVVAGNMGHSERMEYTVIGDTVNLASRLEGMTKELKCDIVISEDLYEQVQAEVSAEPLQKIKVKGRDQEVLVYRVDGLRNDSGNG